MIFSPHSRKKLTERMHSPRSASLHLAPTEGSLENLRMENFRSKDIVVTGNTVIDALLEAASWDTTFADPKLQEATASDKRMVVVTTHRRENLDVMKEIGGAVQDLAKAYPEIYFALPLHLTQLCAKQSFLRLRIWTMSLSPIHPLRSVHEAPGSSNHDSDGLRRSPRGSTFPGSQFWLCARIRNVLRL